MTTNPPQDLLPGLNATVEIVVGTRDTAAHAELIAVEGRKLTFKLHAEDEGETIGGGTHERLMISVDRFDQRMQKKMLLRK